MQRIERTVAKNWNTAQAWSPILLIVVVQPLNLIITMWPSLVMIKAWDGAVVCFAIAAGLASCCEAVALAGSRQESTGHFDPASCRVRDACALRVAQLVGAGLLVIWWLAQCEHAMNATPTVWMPCLGAVCLLIGVSLRATAIATLGAAFHSDIRLEGPPVRRGIYRWCRHPSEIGLCLLAVAGPLLLSAPIAATTAAVLFPTVSHWRCKREDRLLFPALFAGTLECCGKAAAFVQLTSPGTKPLAAHGDQLPNAKRNELR